MTYIPNSLVNTVLDSLEHTLHVGRTHNVRRAPTERGAFYPRRITRAGIRSCRDEIVELITSEFTEDQILVLGRKQLMMRAFALLQIDSFFSETRSRIYLNNTREYEMTISPRSNPRILAKFVFDDYCTGILEEHLSLHLPQES